MKQRILIAGISILIAACASPGPEAPTSAVTEPATAVTAPSASVDAVAPGQNTPTPPAGDLQDPDVSDTPQTASVSPENDPDEMICRRERETGSKFSTRICRTRAEIEAREARDQEIMKVGRKIQTGGACALSNDC